MVYGVKCYAELDSKELTFQTSHLKAVMCVMKENRVRERRRLLLLITGDCEFSLWSWKIGWLCLNYGDFFNLFALSYVPPSVMVNFRSFCSYQWLYSWSTVKWNLWGCKTQKRILQAFWPYYKSHVRAHSESKELSYFFFSPMIARCGSWFPGTLKGGHSSSAASHKPTLSSFNSHLKCLRVSWSKKITWKAPL